MHYYNGTRLHASLNYLPPTEYWTGDPPARLAQRRRKLEAARQRRRARNRERLQAAA